MKDLAAAAEAWAEAEGALDELARTHEARDRDGLRDLAERAANLERKRPPQRAVTLDQLLQESTLADDVLAEIHGALSERRGHLERARLNHWTATDRRKTRNRRARKSRRANRKG